MGVSVQKKVIFLVLALPIVALLVLAQIDGTVDVTSPANGSLLAGTAWINTTFDGTANITIAHNNTGTFQVINSSVNETGSYNFSWDTTQYPDGLYALRINVVNSTNVSDNQSRFVTNLTVDNAPPAIVGLAFSDHNPLNNTADVTINITARDLSGFSAVQLSNGSSSFLILDFTGNSTDRVYSITRPLFDYGCLNESFCSLTVLADDPLGNTNDTVTTDEQQTPLYADTFAPIIVENATNASSILPGANITFAARWTDVVMDDSPRLSVLHEVFLGGEWQDSHERLAQWSVNDLSGNWTNTTYWTNGTDEGSLLEFRITLTDSNGFSNTTPNMSVAVQNASPSFLLLEITNDSVIDNNTAVNVQMLDVGIGINLSTLQVNVTSSANMTITYANNQSLFTCLRTYNTTLVQDNQTCSLDLSWLSGDVLLHYSISDAYGNSNTTILGFFIAHEPDITNLTINGQRISNETPAQIGVNITNASREVSFNWTVSTNADINTTKIAFLNSTNPQVRSFAGIPAGTIYNVTAGRNYMRINVTLNASLLTDTVQINLTANVPINLSALQAQYAQGLVSDWRVVLDGVWITDERFVNDTFDILVNYTNGTHQEPFTARLNYTGIDGLSLRWNATQDAFRAVMETESFENVTQSNITHALRHDGQTALFFDEREYQVAVTFNVSALNTTPYYQLGNVSGHTTYLLEECDSLPTGTIGAEDACYSNGTGTITLHVPRWEEQDRLLLSRPDDRGPNISILTNNLISQSILPLSLRVATPNPNATLCMYNLSFYNQTSGNTSDVDVQTLPSSVFSVEKQYYGYDENISRLDDGMYNLTITCADDQDQTAVQLLNINLTDTTKPILSNVAVSAGNDEATISGTSNEHSTFTVYYGTQLDDLSNSVAGDATPSTSESIEITGLARGTTYYANMTACDEAGNCNTSATQSFSTAAASSGGSGGGGGGGGGTEATQNNREAESVDSRLWSDLQPGQVIDYEPGSLVITRVILQFTNHTPSAKLTISQYAGTPDGIDPAPGNIYKYFEIDADLENVDRREVFFDASGWIENVTPESVVLYRLENNGWRPYYPEREGNAFHVFLPGFSWFAISGTAEVSGPAEPIQEGPGPSDPVEEKPEELPNSTFVSALGESDPDRGLHPFVWILGLVVVAACCVLGGLKGYQMYQQVAEEHNLQVAQEHEEYLAKKQGRITRPLDRPREHDPMAQLHDYIAKMRERGHDDARIRSRLEDAGWDEVIVEQEMMR